MLRVALLVSVLLPFIARPAAAQTETPVPTTAPATIPYTDAAFGFELQIPAGWEYDRTRFQPYERSIGLLRGRSPGGQSALQILVFRIQPEAAGAGAGEKLRIPPFEDWIEEFARTLGENANAERLEWETWKLPPRAGALLSYHAKLGATDTINYALCVPFDPSTVWVLAFSAALLRSEDQATIRPAFDALARTLKIHYDAMEIEALASAYERGKGLIDRIRKRGSELHVDDAEHCYLLVLSGRPIGYFERRLSIEEQSQTSADARQRVVQRGLRVRERSWRFADDGTVRYSRLDLFSAFNLERELIESELTQIPAPDVRPQQLLIKTDQAVRTADVLVPSYRTSLDVALPPPATPMSVGPVYLDLAWTRVLPMLLRDAPHETHAFVVYSVESRALLPQTFKPLGEKALEGRGDKVLAFEVREGLVDTPSTLYVDQTGALVRLEAGDLLVLRTTRAEIDAKFGAKRDEARKRFRLAEP